MAAGASKRGSRTTRAGRSAATAASIFSRFPHPVNASKGEGTFASGRGLALHKPGDRREAVVLPAFSDQ